MTDGADAVLAILVEKSDGQDISDADWKRLFSSEGYVRLKKREASIRRDFTDEDFRKFVLSDELAARADALQKTLDQWRTADLRAAADEGANQKELFVRAHREKLPNERSSVTHRFSVGGQEGYIIVGM